jgi:hypothetical protein
MKLKILFFAIDIICCISYLSATNSNLSIFYYTPQADVFSAGELETVSFNELERGASNPSFLGNLKKHSISASMWKDYYGSGYYGFVSGTYRLNAETGVNISYLGYNSSSEDVYYMDNTSESIVYEKDSMFSASIGRKLSDFVFLGTKLKYIKSTLAEKYDASSFTFDMDSFIKLKYGIVFSAGVRNIVGDLKYDREKENLPLFYHFEVTKLFQTNFIDIRTGIGLKKTDDYDSRSLGLSLKFLRFPLTINGGYISDDNDDSFSTGLGLVVNSLSIDYGIRFGKFFDNYMQRFSLSYFFDIDNEKKIEKNTIKRENSNKIKEKKKDDKKNPQKTNNIIVI